MLKAPDKLWQKFDALMDRNNVPEKEQWSYRKWLRYYLDFCHKYKHNYAEKKSLHFFLKKLESKRQNATQRKQAVQAVEFYYLMLENSNGEHTDGNLTISEKSDIYAKKNTIRRRCNEPTNDVEREKHTKITETGASWQRKYTALRDAIKIRHYSPRTLKTYRMWL